MTRCVALCAAAFVLACGGAYATDEALVTRSGHTISWSVDLSAEGGSGWTVSVDDHAVLALGYIVDVNAIEVTEPQGIARRFDPATGETLWSTFLGQAPAVQPRIATTATTAVVCADRSLVGLDLGSGSRLWSVADIGADISRVDVVGDALVTFGTDDVLRVYGMRAGGCGPPSSSGRGIRYTS